jgi:hypothetical protein
MTSPKYPRTMHLPWSEGATNDDKIADSVEALLDVPIVITEKVDGSNVCLESDGCFARSHSGPPTHRSFDPFKALYASLKHNLSEHLQFFGEWLYAKHSLAYDKLPAYFLLFGVRDSYSGVWLSWDTTQLCAEKLSLYRVPGLYRGTVANKEQLKALTLDLAKEPSTLGTIREGVVVRVARAFTDEEFPQCVQKWVRKDHVQTDVHWKHQTITPNGLAK